MITFGTTNFDTGAQCCAFKNSIFFGYWHFVSEHLFGQANSSKINKYSNKQSVAFSQNLRTWPNLAGALFVFPPTNAGKSLWEISLEHSVVASRRRWFTNVSPILDFLEIKCVYYTFTVRCWILLFSSIESLFELCVFSCFCVLLLYWYIKFNSSDFFHICW